MTHEDVHKILRTIIYPQLERDIISLDTVHSIQVQGNTLEIALAIEDNSIYAPVANAISKACKPYFSEVRVMKYTPSQSNTFQYQKLNNCNSKNILAISGGKGGVGKSTIAVNLALSFVKKGLHVGILDADIYTPAIPKLLQIDEMSLHWNNNNQIVPCEKLGLKIMSTGFTSPKSDAPLMWRSAMAISLLMQFINDVNWGELDLLIIDMPSGGGDLQMHIMQELKLSGCLFITTPHYLSYDSAGRTIRLFQELNVPIMGVVENMSCFTAQDSGSSYQIFGESNTLGLCKHYRLPLLAKIPLLAQNKPLEAPGESSPYAPLAKTLLSQLF